MAEATTTAGPSHATRTVILQVTDRGVDLAREVDAFVVHAQEAREAFDSEVDPLHLPDDHYTLVVDASGLGGMLRVAHRMQEALYELVSAA